MQVVNIKKTNELKSALKSLTHDLKTPLNNIIGFSDLLKDLLIDCENEDTANFIKIIKLEAEHASKMINKLSDYNKNTETNFADIDAKKIKEILEISRKEHNSVVI